MKKLFGLIISLMVFIPTVVLAEEEAYEYFDFKVDMVEGSVIKDTNIKIFASVTSDDTNLTDRTDEFNVEEVMWSVCVDTDCAITEEVADDAVFEADKDYLFMIRITAINGADINVWGTDRAKFNGTPIENLDGEYGNTGKELMIKSKTAKETVVSDDIAVPKEEIEEPEVIAPAPTTGTTETCMFGFPFCLNY